MLFPIILNVPVCNYLFLLGSGVASLGHFDGKSTDEGIKGMIASVSRLSTSQSDNGRQVKSLNT